MAARTAACESVMRRGGDVGLLNGLSVSRTEARAMMTASGGVGEEAIADSMSCELSGEPETTVRSDVGVREEGFRTRAVTVCFRASASLRIREPVLPVAPRMRICILSSSKGRGRRMDVMIRKQDCSVRRRR